jgi:hypothetical protein
VLTESFFSAIILLIAGLDIPPAATVPNMIFLIALLRDEFFMYGRY